MKTKFRKLIRQIIRENYSQELMNSLLDRVSEYGEESLGLHDKEIMKKISDGSFDIKNNFELGYDYLMFYFKKLNAEEYTELNWGHDLKGIKYYLEDFQNEKNHLVLNYIIYDRPLRNNLVLSKPETLFVDAFFNNWFSAYVHIGVNERQELYKSCFQDFTGLNVENMQILHLNSYNK